MKTLAGKKIAVFALVTTTLLTGSVLWHRSQGPAPAPSRNETLRESPARKSAQRASVQGAILARTSELQECYNSYLTRDPAVTEGAVKVDWLIDRRGQVAVAEVRHSDLQDEELLSCVVDQIRTWTFAPPEKESMVAHKFKFRQRSPASVRFE
ncbi:MAG: AgmX/PglI C-terminal domain-containing protein [Bdellovibrionaceae bacterium]|nr:AgmX/PglI C-terminal domain-containing protein [Pseudobdellovibrionaceae bacterium]